MPHWNHRVVRSTNEDGSYWYSVREVFYNESDEIYAITDEPVDISGADLSELIEYTQRIMNCFNRPILIEEEIEYVQFDDGEYK